MAKKQNSESAEAPSFEQSLARLEQLVDQLEEGRLTLNDSLSAYEEGVKHIQLCRKSLDEAERKIEILSGFDAEGNPITQPFDDAATGTAANVGKRSRKAANPARPADEESSTVDEPGQLF